MQRFNGFKSWSLKIKRVKFDMSALRIPATVITGFLGTGKTTLIRHMISKAAGKRLAFIVNEFGDIGMDAALISDCIADGSQIYEIIELANGCICCTAADDFLPSMQGLLMRQPLPDHIIIEASGLALPQPLVQAFNRPGMRNRFALDGVVTLVDGPAMACGSFALDQDRLEVQRKADDKIDKESPIEELLRDQIRAANMIVLSKVDQLDGHGLARAYAAIDAYLNEPTPIITAANGVAPIDVILGMNMEEQAHKQALCSHHHDQHQKHEHNHDTFSSVVVVMPRIASVDALEAQLSVLAGEFGILRAKGRLSVDGKTLPLVVQAVGQRVDSYYSRAISGTVDQLVMIGPAGLNFGMIAARLGGYLLNTQKNAGKIAATEPD